MMDKIYTSSAPSNIALIKYMGKSSTELNQATNSSISYTLSHLKSEVSLKLTETLQWDWSSDSQGAYPLELSDSGKMKFIMHWERCMKRLAPGFQALKKGIQITSINNFPSDCGLASSASSFAALTLVSYQMFKDLKLLEREWSLEDLAQLSREGSGSSCRSFFNSWVYWSGQEVRSIINPSNENPWSDLLHMVVIVDEKKKKVSSSEAHKKVMTSALFEGRVHRAEQRAQQLEFILNSSHSIKLNQIPLNLWTTLFELSWAEFWDMHSLFETSKPPFYYMSPKSLLALRFFQNDWNVLCDGPVITMDAGPNIHLLYRSDQMELRKKHRAHLTELDFSTITESHNDKNLS